MLRFINPFRFRRLLFLDEIYHHNNEFEIKIYHKQKHELIFMLRPYGYAGACLQAAWLKYNKVSISWNTYVIGVCVVHCCIANKNFEKVKRNTMLIHVIDNDDTNVVLKYEFDFSCYHIYDLVNNKENVNNWWEIGYSFKSRNFLFTFF